MTIDTASPRRVLIVESDGRHAGVRRTYRAATIDGLVAAVTTDQPWFLIEGSATQVITVKRITVSGLSLTSPEYLLTNVIKYSTAASGGTATTLANIPVDSTFAAGTALVQAYTAAPTGGTPVGAVASLRTMAEDTTPVQAASPIHWIFNFGDMPETRGIVLRGAAQGLGLVWGTAPATAVTLALDIEWTEEGL